MTAALPLLPLLARGVALRCLRSSTTGLFPELRLASLLLSVDRDRKRFADSIALEVPRSGRSRYEPGERFRFALYASAAHAERLQRIESLLRGLPGAAPRREPDIVFGDNWAFDSIEDLVPDGVIDAQTLAREAAHLRAQGRVRMRLVSPVRLALRDSGARKGRQRYARSERDVTDDALSHACTQSLVALKFCSGAQHWQVPDLRLRIVRRELFLLPSTTAAEPGRKTLDEGLMGEIVVEPAEPDGLDLWPCLVLLQYLGIGQGRAFGLGRFQCETLVGECRKHRQSVEHDLLRRAAEERNLTLAWRHVGRADDLREWPGIPASGDDADDAQRSSPEEHSAWFDRLSERLADGQHAPAPLRPVEIAKPEGGVRRLQIPGFRDRVAQRALLQVIEPALDPLLSEAAYGFRRGRGREQARDRLLAWERAGARVVGAIDLGECFDALPWPRIEARLRSLFGDEPAVAQIMSCLEAPHADGAPRTRGLPPGAPLSPILADLMLDPIDRAMVRTGHGALRLGETLVVVGANRAAVEAALARVLRSLADIGCATDRSHVQVHAFEAGFRMFGYRFFGGLALPGRPGARSVAVDEGVGWLAGAEA
jgi:CRISPR-associated protein Cas1